MTSPVVTQAERRRRREACFASVLKAALEGRRCPENETEGVTSTLMAELAHTGWIRIEITSRNYRTVVILAGEHAGKQTAPDPRRTMPWKIIDKNGTRVN